jgi:hypothetical protein
MPHPAGVSNERSSKWISYCPLVDTSWLQGGGPLVLAHHHLLATPQGAWKVRGKRIASAWRDISRASEILPCAAWSYPTTW